VGRTLNESEVKLVAHAKIFVTVSYLGENMPIAYEGDKAEGDLLHPRGGLPAGEMKHGPSP
jgi:hypothetical protein